LLATPTGEPATSAANAPLAALRASILDCTAGTPFFMEEVVQAMFEEGALVREANGRVNLPAGAKGMFEIPTTVQSVLAARMG
jgi:predicted ATPase